MASSLNKNFKAGETQGQAEEKAKQVLGNIGDKTIAAKDTTQQASQAAIEKTQQTARAGLEVAQGKAGQVKEKGLEVGQSIKETAESGKDDNTGGELLQQKGETVKDVTQENTGQAKEKGSEVGQSIKETTDSGKDSTGGFLQQTGETIKGVAFGATEAVKQTVGIGQNDQDKTNKPKNSAKF